MKASRAPSFGWAALLACICAAARAHAFLERAEPPVGASVRFAPHEIRLHYSERIESAFSVAEVQDVTGRVIPGATVRVDATEPNVLRVVVPSLAPARYRVVWRVLSVDTHPTSGDYWFTVLP